MVGALLLAAAFRFAFPNWDAGIAAHPDERYLLGVAQSLGREGSPCLAATDFAYGHLPVYLARLLILAAPSADPLYAARLVSGLVGVLLVALTGACSRLLAGPRGALLGTFVAAVAPFLVQQGHYYTVDPLGAVLVTAALLAAARQRWLVAGGLAGLAVACKLSMIWVLVPLGVTALGVLGRPRWRSLARGLPALLSLSGGALVAFGLASPWALLTPGVCWRGPLIQVAMAAGRYDFPYIRQYAGTWPWLYPLGQIALWGVGPLAAAAGVAGLLLGIRRWARTAAAVRLMWLWPVLGFAVYCGAAVKFPRYALPIYPGLIAWGAAALLAPPGRVVGPLRRGLIALLALTTLSLGVAQVTSYARPHPWLAASRWIYANLPAGATIAVEAWDHPLPVPLPEGAVERYVQAVLPTFDEDSPAKREALARALRDADAIVLASRRGYGALSRQPERYRDTLAWYGQLLREREILAFGRCPALAGISLSDDPLLDAGLPAVLSLAERCGTSKSLRLPHLDESFRVYEHPTVLLAVRRARPGEDPALDCR